MSTTPQEITAKITKVKMAKENKEVANKLWYQAQDFRSVYIIWSILNWLIVNKKSI